MTLCTIADNTVEPAQRDAGSSQEASAISTLDAFRRRSTTEDVARAVREAIISGELPQGSKVAEVALAQRLHVGRGPVREAIRQLVQEGLMEYHVNRGAFVKTVAIEDVRDVYIAREAIETQAVTRILALGPSVDFTAVDAALEAIRAAALGQQWPTDALVEADIQLHQTLVDLAGSPRLTRMFDTLSAEMRMFLLQNHPPYEGARYVFDHELLVQAITTRDARAPEVIREHLVSSLGVIVEWMDGGDPATADAT